MIAYNQETDTTYTADTFNLISDGNVHFDGITHAHQLTLWIHFRFFFCISFFFSKLLTVVNIMLATDMGNFRLY